MAIVEEYEIKERMSFLDRVQAFTEWNHMSKYLYKLASDRLQTRNLYTTLNLIKILRVTIPE